MRKGYRNQRKIDRINLMLIRAIIVCLILIVALVIAEKVTQNKNVGKTVEMSDSDDKQEDSDETVNVSRDNLRIKVLNCTKIDGLAGKVQEELNAKGYKNVDVGNAQEREVTEVQIKNEQSKTLIEQDFDSSNIKVGILEKYDVENQYDIIILVAKDYKKVGEM